MTSLAELVETPPAATRGVAAGFTSGAGIWRHVVEIADPSAGSAVQWYDITAIAGAFTGYDYSRGSDTYQGRYRASVVTLDLYAHDDRFAPWNDDTSATFGTHVELGPGLLIRSGFIRVSGGVVVEWNPRFTNKIESWADASFSRGKVRQHRVIARDLFTSIVGVPLPARVEEPWSERMYAWLVDSGWPYGSLIYGVQYEADTTTPILTLAARPEAVSAVVELDAICDPTGLVWYTDRYGHLVVRPRTDDTFHAAVFAAGATGDEYVPPELVSFAWWACDDEEPDDAAAGVAAYALDTPGVPPFGIDKTERSVINHVKISTPSTPFDDDDPISIQRYDRHTLQASWIAENDVVAAAILSSRAFADREARPVTTTVDLRNFHPGPARVDFCDELSIEHRNGDEGMTCTAHGWLRNYRERVSPRGCDTAWELAITFDVFAASSSASMLPVYALTLTDVTDTSASFSWYNPTQAITPTHTQIRLLSTSSIWATVAYPGVGGPVEASWSGLHPSTAYEFQVRLVRIVDGIVTDFSPTRAVNFVTAATTVPVVDGDDVTFPTPDAGCYLEWELQSTSDGTTWTTIDDGEDHTPPWEMTYDFSSLPDDVSYRFASREVCAGVPGAWAYSTNTVLACIGDDRLSVDPYDDAALVAYFPHVCPDHIAEAVSGEPVTLGPAFDGWHLVDDVPVLDSAAAGLVAYGVQPSPVVDFDDGLTIVCRGRLDAQPGVERRVFAYAGLALSIVNDGAGFALKGSAVEVGPTVTTISGSTVLTLSTIYDLALTHDPTSGDLRLYVDAVLEASALGIVGDRYNFGSYEMQLPASSWVTDCAVWDRVLAANELPGAPLALTVTIDQKPGQSDPATGTPVLFQAVFSQAVTGFAGTDVTLSGTALPTVAALSTLDNITYTIAVSGMSTSGTVVASIAAAVCTATATGTPNDASTSTDNTITWTAPLAPSTLFFDNFNRANNASMGASWSDTSGWAISGNVASLGGVGGIHREKCNTSMGGPDHHVSGIISGDAAQHFYSVLIARWDTTTNTGYEAHFNNYSSGGGDRWMIQRFVGTTYTTVATSAITAHNPASRVLFEVEGTALRVYTLSAGVWTLVLSVTDSTYTTGNFVGLAGLRTTGTQTVEDFEAGTGFIANTVVTFSDNFNRANDTNLGVNWVEYGDGGLIVVGNQLNSSGATTNRGAFWATPLSTSDHYVQLLASSNSLGMSLYARHNNPNNDGASTGYECYWDPGSGGNVALRRRSGASFTAISSVTGVGATLAGKVLRLEVQGTTLRVKLDGFTVLTATDATYSTGGYVGLRIDNSLQYADDFKTGPL